MPKPHTGIRWQWQDCRLSKHCQLDRNQFTLCFQGGYELLGSHSFRLLKSSFNISAQQLKGTAHGSVGAQHADLGESRDYIREQLWISQFRFKLWLPSTDWKWTDWSWTSTALLYCSNSLHANGGTAHVPHGWTDSEHRTMLHALQAKDQYYLVTHCSVLENPLI